MDDSSRLEIPAPPAGSSNSWPWQAASEIPADIPSAPLISVIIPSFNQGQFIEETLRSLILQNYERLEIIVIDGGSTDNTSDVIRKYEPWLKYWVSEKDLGQANAINKGLAVSRGEIVKWLNSDDLLLPGALHELAKNYVDNPNCFFVSPVEHFLSGSNKRRIFEPKNVNLRDLVEFWSGRMAWNDPGTFYTRKVLATVGVIDENYRYSFDYDFVLRVRKRFEPVYVKKPLAAFRVHADSKTVSEGERFIFETTKVSQQYWAELGNIDERGFQKYFAVAMFRNGVSNLLRKPAAAVKYFWRGFSTNVLLSSWWLLAWVARVLRSKMRTGTDADWSGFGT